MKPGLDDDAQLAAMGHRAELKRNFSMMYVATQIMSILPKIDWMPGQCLASHLQFSM